MTGTQIDTIILSHSEPGSNGIWNKTKSNKSYLVIEKTYMFICVHLVIEKIYMYI